MLRHFLPTLLEPDPPGAGGGGGGAPSGGGAGGDGGGAPAGEGGGGGSSADAFDSMFNDLDGPAPSGTPPAGGGGGAPPPAGGKPPEKPAGGAKPPAGGKPPEKPAATTPPKPGEKPPGGQPQPEFEEVEGVQVPKFKSDKEFRGWGLNGYKRAKQLETELQAIQAKYQELEKIAPNSKAEREQLQTRLADLEKKFNEKEQEIKFLNYERSGEYVEKYQTPYKNAVQAAYNDMKELTVTEPDMSQPVGENGQRPTKERAATPADFDSIYGLPLGQATKLANQLFGHAASIVMGHRNEIRRLAQAAVNAVNDWKAKAKEREEKEKADAVTHRDFVSRTWSEVNNNLVQKYPDLFAPDSNDPEGNKKLEEGQRMADAFFADRSSSPLEHRIVFDAQIRNRIAAFPRLKYQRDKLRAENEQLKKDLAELRASNPGAPGGGGTPPAGEQTEGALETFEQRL